MSGQLIQPGTIPDRVLGAPAITPEVERAASEGAIFAFNLSGGKDCGGAAAAANAWLDLKCHPRDRRLAIHADLGRAEWRSTPGQVRAQAQALGLPLDVVRRQAGDLVARFERRWELSVEAYLDLRLYHLRGPWSSPSLKFCQSEMKAHVMGPYLARKYRGEKIVQVVGIRRDESRRRASTPIYKPDYRDAERGNRHGTEMALWHPAVLWSAEETFDVNRVHGVPLAESYTRYNSTRHSCAFCIMASIGDHRAAASADQNDWVLLHYCGMEADTGYSFMADRWLADVAPAKLDQVLRARIHLAKRWAGDRRAIEAAMPPRHRYVDGWPLHQPTMEEAEIIAASRRQIIDHYGWAHHYATARQVYDRFAELLTLKAAKVST
jgi:3'-phosphoadenosine 5'-phosphosulfate sulfotransferase (PAPS reductase)/FAD synthetase